MLKNATMKHSARQNQLTRLPHPAFICSSVYSHGVHALLPGGGGAACPSKSISPFLPTTGRGHATTKNVCFACYHALPYTSPGPDALDGTPHPREGFLDPFVVIAVARCLNRSAETSGHPRHVVLYSSVLLRLQQCLSGRVAVAQPLFIRDDDDDLGAAHEC